MKLQQVKNFAIVAFIGLSLSGCITQRKCLRRFPPETKIITKDSVVYRDKIVIRDTTITVKLPGDTVKIEVPIAKAYDPVSVETKYAKATAQIIADRIKLALIQKDSEIQVHIDSARIEAEYWREKYNTDQKTITVKEKIVPNFYKACLWVCIGLLVAIIIILKIKK